MTTRQNGVRFVIAIAAITINVFPVFDASANEVPPFLETCAASAEDDCRRSCQAAVYSCYDFCKTVRDPVNCRQGCLNRYKSCKIGCGDEL